MADSLWTKVDARYWILDVHEEMARSIPLNKGTMGLFHRDAFRLLDNEPENNLKTMIKLDDKL